MMEHTSSPCVLICAFDPASGLCMGCGRSGAEIGRWVAMSEAERLALMAHLPERFEQVPSLKTMREARLQTIRRRRKERSVGFPSS